LGDLAVFSANLLRGKNKPVFTPHVDCGDYLIIRNAKNIKLTGKKLTDKKYYNHSLYIGGLRTRSAKEMLEKYPEEMIYEAIKGMIPKNRLGRSVINKLFVYGDNGKAHEAQNPARIQIR
jgi:large subunit ribosomal protein L13